MDDKFKKLGKLVASSVLTKISLPVLATVICIVVAIVIIVAAILGNGTNDLEGGGGKSLPEEVMKWEDNVDEALEEEDLDEEYKPVMLAILNQETGGDMAESGGDIFQSSESKCGEIGCISDPQESTDQAVKHFKDNLDHADGNDEVAIASYNFGNGFAEWTQEHHDNEWSEDIAIEFSKEQMDKVDDPDNYSCINEEAEEAGACFGDFAYVKRIVDFVPEDSELAVGDDDSDDDGSKSETIKGDLKSPLDNDDLEVTSGFGGRDSPGGVGSSDHKGVDLDCNRPDDIHAVQDGEIKHAGEVSGYGNYVLVKHDDDSYTGYGHMSDISVSDGDSIDGGEKVGECGSTGDSTGDHLHFETKSEEWDGFDNPADYLGV